MQAFTAIGLGDMTDVISANTSIESPLPTLLIASSDSISIQDVDIDKNYPLLHSIKTPTEITYLMKENKIFWINEMHELLVFSQKNSTKYYKVLDVNSNVTGLTTDWVERSLYFVQINTNPKSSIIYKVDLNLMDRGITRAVEVLKRDAIIAKLEVSPFTRYVKHIHKIDIQHSTTGSTYEHWAIPNLVNFRNDFLRNNSLLNSEK